MHCNNSLCIKANEALEGGAGDQLDHTDVQEQKDNKL